MQEPLQKHIGGRDKPKDSYDFCYCLEHVAGGMDSLSSTWKKRESEADIIRAIAILKEKFVSVKAFGPQQVVEFGNSANDDERGHASAASLRVRSGVSETYGVKRWPTDMPPGTP